MPSSRRLDAISRYRIRRRRGRSAATDEEFARSLLPADLQILLLDDRLVQAHDEGYDLGAREPENLLVEKQNHERLLLDYFLDLPVDRLAGPRVDLAAAALRECVDLGHPAVAAIDALAGVED